MPKAVTSVTAKATGYIPGFRVWELTAFDGDKPVLKIDQDYGNNKAKFDDFMKKLDELGYALKYDQIQYITGELLLNWTPPPCVTNNGVAGLVPYGSYIKKAAQLG